MQYNAQLLELISDKHKGGMSVDQLTEEMKAAGMEKEEISVYISKIAGSKRRGRVSPPHYFYSSIIFFVICVGLAVYHYRLSLSGGTYAPSYSAVCIICSLLAIGFISQALAVKPRRSSQ